MANTYIGTKHPKGNVGVRGVVDGAELSAYSQGVLSGFVAKSAASWTLQIGGNSGTQDVAIGKNPGGESDLFVGTAGQSIAFIIGGAPGTPGQSRTDALVIYKDPLSTALSNDGIDTVDYMVVPGTAATTGTQTPPSMSTIRSTIPSGALKFVAVIGYVTVANGASSVTTGNHTTHLADFNTLLMSGKGKLEVCRGIADRNVAAGSAIITNTIADMASVTVTTDGGEVLVDAFAYLYNAGSGAPRTGQVELWIDGVKDKEYQSPTNTVLLSYSSTPAYGPTNCRLLYKKSGLSAGSHTFAIRAAASANSAVGCPVASIKVSELLDF